LLLGLFYESSVEIFVLFIFTGRKTKQDNIEEASPKPKEESDKVYTNKLAEQSIALEEGIHNIPEVVVKDTQEDSVGQRQIKE
jgi:hypothetical protein